jgi:hypothetical protein
MKRGGEEKNNAPRSKILANYLGGSTTGEGDD